MYEVWIGRRKVPVPPDEIKIKVKNRNETIVLIDDGEATNRKIPGLTDIAFNLLLPNVNYPFSQTDDHAEDMLDYLQRVKENKRKVEVIINRSFPNGQKIYDTDILCTLEELETLDDVGEGFDNVVSLSFKQFKPFGTQTAKIKKKKKSSDKKTVTKKKKSRNTKTKTEKQTYTVKSGDSLCAIAKKFYTDESLYTIIRDANKAIIEAHHGGPNMIWPGDKLTIPAREIG